MRDRGIYGLVLAGGQSSRMGTEKAELIYFDRPQWAYCANLLAPFCDKVYISVDSADQLEDVPETMQLVDKHQNMGPFSGILTALDTHPENTWLVLACDMPGTDRALMNRLARHRDPDALASCFRGPDGKIEPLLSFWEPAARKVLDESGTRLHSPSEFLSRQNTCLIDLEAIHFDKLKSVNTPEERRAFMKRFSTGRDSYQEI